jgi:hypothetical protein
MQGMVVVVSMVIRHRKAVPTGRGVPVVYDSGYRMDVPTGRMGAADYLSNTT